MTSITYYRVHCYGGTDVGKVREHNEDSFLVADLSEGRRKESTGVLQFASGPHGALFTVADGMGGAAAGEMASKLGVQTLYREVQDLVTRRRGSGDGVIEDILIDAVGTANRRIYQLSARNDELRGMGTTLTSVLELDGRLLIGQIGDSRAYLIRGNSIRQLTRDQSLVAHRVSAGILTEEEARRHPERNVLLQALGVRDSVELVLRRITVHPMDVLLLCSDGLHGQMTSEEICRIIVEAPGLDAACQRLIDLANSRGGPDNITAVLAEFLPARTMGFYQGLEDDESGLFDFTKK